MGCGGSKAAALPVDEPEQASSPKSPPTPKAIKGLCTACGEKLKELEHKALFEPNPRKGDVGFELKEGRSKVQSVTPESQAALKGVKVGMEIVAIDGNAELTDANTLNDRITGQNSFEVTFKEVVAFCGNCGQQNEEPPSRRGSKGSNESGGLRAAAAGGDAPEDFADYAEMVAHLNATLPPEMKSGKLKVTMISAANLRVADWSFGGGSSDPYCTVEIIGKAESRVQTKHISKSLNPTWNETHPLEDFEVGDALLFKVFDYDKVGDDDLLGSAELDGSFFLREGGFSNEILLVEDGATKKNKKGAGPATVTVKVEVVPGRKDTLPISVPGSRLRVLIGGAAGLRAADFSIVGSGKSDPYCSCQVVGKEDSLVETSVLNKTLDPVWNEEFIIDDYDRGDSLEFRVFDHDKVGDDDSLGWLSLKCREFDRDDGGFDGELRLKDCGKGHAAKLKFLVEVIPPALPDAPSVWQPGCELKVDIIGASGLRAADIALVGKGKSDPFCRCQIEGREDSITETKHLSKTLDPMWNEQHEIEYFQQGDPLFFEVFDHDMGGGNDRLGKVQLNARDYDREGGFDGELRLKGCGKGNISMLRVKVTIVPPEIPDGIPISKPGSRLMVKIIGAEGLRAADFSVIGQGKSDPYCVCEIRDKEDSLCQTKHCSKTLSPVWDEEFEVLDFMPGDDIIFSVFDHDMVGAADLLGRATLLNWKFDREGGFEGKFKLKETGKTRGSMLTVKAMVLPPRIPDADPVSLPGSRLQIHLLYAKGLRAADFSIVGKAASDPFVCCEIAGNEDSYIQTRHIAKTLDPVWDEEHEIEDFNRGDDLKFTVFDYDMVGSPDALGQVIMPAREYDRAGGYDSSVYGELRLRKCGKGKVSMLAVKILVLPPEVADRPPISVPGSRLKIQILSATGLRKADLGMLGGSSDPFCICRVPGKSDAEFHTHVVSKSLDPIWDEEFDYEEFDRGDELEFTVMDHDKIGASDLLGHRTIPSFKFDREGGFQGELKLKKCGRGKKSVLTIAATILPPLKMLAPPISEKDSRLRITIINASGLRAADHHIKGASSDPYCTYQIVGKPTTMFQTKVVKRCLDPLWDEEVVMPDYEMGDRIEFRILDKDKLSGDDLLGRCTLACREFDHAKGFSGQLQLKSSGPQKKNKNPPMIRVKVSVLPSLATEERLLLEKRLRKEEARERKMMYKAESDQLAAEEYARQLAEAAAIEAERIAAEERRRKAEEEAIRLAGLRARAAAEAVQITVPIHAIFAPDEILAEVVLPHGSTIEDLAVAAWKMARLPMIPRLLLGAQVLGGKGLLHGLLIDIGVNDGCPVLAEMAVALTTSKDCTAKAWDALTGECLYTLTGHEKAVCSSCSSPDLKWLATCSEDETAKLWVVRRDEEQAQCLFTLRGHTKAVNSVAFSSDGKFIVTGSSDNTAKVWAVKTGECKRTYEGHRGAVFAASFTPDGTRIQTQSRDSTAKNWEVETGRCTSTEPLWEQPEIISCSAEDGNIVVSASGGSSAKVADAASGEEVSLDGHTDEILSVAFLSVVVQVRSQLALTATRRSSPTNKGKSMTGTLKKEGSAGRTGNFAKTPKNKAGATR